MQTYANFRFNSCINLAEKAYKSVSSQKMAIDCNLYLRCEQKF